VLRHVDTVISSDAGTQRVIVSALNEVVLYPLVGQEIGLRCQSILPRMPLTQALALRSQHAKGNRPASRIGRRFRPHARHLIASVGHATGITVSAEDGRWPSAACFISGGKTAQHPPA
jgi:hypothetical protein